MQFTFLFVRTCALHLPYLLHGSIVGTKLRQLKGLKLALSVNETGKAQNQFGYAPQQFSSRSRSSWASIQVRQAPLDYLVVFPSIVSLVSYQMMSFRFENTLENLLHVNLRQMPLSLS